MSKVLKKILLVSSDDLLNKALIDQFELVELFSVEVSQTLISINELDILAFKCTHDITP